MSEDTRWNCNVVQNQPCILSRQDLIDALVLRELFSIWIAVCKYNTMWRQNIQLLGSLGISCQRIYAWSLSCAEVCHVHFYMHYNIWRCKYDYFIALIVVLIEVFLSFSFGKRSAGSFRRGCECIVLEPSEMIVVRVFFWFSCFQMLQTSLETLQTPTKT